VSFTELDLVAGLLKTEDNCGTADPIFTVQQRVRIYGIDPDYDSTACWINEDGREITLEGDPEKFKLLELMSESSDDLGDLDIHFTEWSRCRYRDVWEHVQAFLTRNAAESFCRREAHNLRETRIYVESAHRNPEWRWLRELLPVVATELRELEALRLMAKSTERGPTGELRMPTHKEGEAEICDYCLARTDGPHTIVTCSAHLKACRDHDQRLIRELEVESKRARDRLLELSDYTDEDAERKTLTECVDLAELEVNCEYEQRLEFEAKVQTLEKELRRVRAAKGAEALRELSAPPAPAPEVDGIASTEKPDIAACPFCGSENTSVDLDMPGVMCHACGATGPNIPESVECETDDEMVAECIRLWNEARVRNAMGTLIADLRRD
jgi:hypothetical protein